MLQGKLKRKGIGSVSMKGWDAVLKRVVREDREGSISIRPEGREGMSQVGSGGGTF